MARAIAQDAGGAGSLRTGGRGRAADSSPLPRRSRCEAPVRRDRHAARADRGALSGALPGRGGGARRRARLERDLAPRPRAAAAHSDWTLCSNLLPYSISGPFLATVARDSEHPPGGSAPRPEGGGGASRSGARYRRLGPVDGRVPGDLPGDHGSPRAAAPVLAAAEGGQRGLPRGPARGRRRLRPSAQRGSASIATCCGGAARGFEGSSGTWSGRNAAPPRSRPPASSRRSARRPSASTVSGRFRGGRGLRGSGAGSPAPRASGAIIGPLASDPEFRRAIEEIKLRAQIESIVGETVEPQAERARPVGMLPLPRGADALLQGRPLGGEPGTASERAGREGTSSHSSRSGGT